MTAVFAIVFVLWLILGICGVICLKYDGITNYPMIIFWVSAPVLVIFAEICGLI